MNSPAGPKPEQQGFLAPGVVVDNCRIEELRGRGAFGAVFRAFHVALEHPRALKFLISGTDVSDEDKRRFLVEARHTARLSHPNIVIIHNVGDYRGMPFIHMEYLNGVSLRATIQKGQLPPEEAVRVMDQVLAALAAAHEQGIVHRDVKPENVMVRDDGAVKVVDFGLSLNVQAHTSRLTLMSNQAMGTPLYMAPEQWQTSWVGPAADVWSAGVMLYELLSGQRPFKGQGIARLKENVERSGHVPLHQAAAHLPDRLREPLSALVDRMLAKAARDRLPDAVQARLELRKLAKRQPASLFASLLTPEPEAESQAPPAAPVEGLVSLPVTNDRIMRFRRSRDNAVMLLLPGGEFFMGTETGDSDERPRHRVRLSSFLLDETPVTRRQFATFLSLWGLLRDDAGNPLLDIDIAGLERVGMCWEPEAGEAEPVVGVTWHGAAAYARWAGMQLPSEAQLECAWSAAALRAKHLEHGLRCWCADAYDECYYKQSPTEDPVNGAAGSFVAIRGCSRLQGSAGWSIAQRQFAAAHELAVDLGFHCARTVSRDADTVP